MPELRSMGEHQVKSWHRKLMELEELISNTETELDQVHGRLQALYSHQRMQAEAETAF